MAKKLIAFCMLCLYMLGTIGGIGYAIHGKAWVIAVGVLATGWMAWPSAVKYRNILIGEVWP